MKMTMKAILAAGAFAIASTGGAFAQATGAANPEMPSALECKNGYKEGMKWTKDDFDAACIKVKTNAVPAGQSK